MTKKALDYFAAEPWAMEPGRLRAFAAIVDRKASDFEAVERLRAERLKNAEAAQSRDGVAIVNVAGPIFRHANIFTEVSGASSIEQLARDFTVAEQDEGIEAILLNIDSPGGMVSGINEFAAMVAASPKKTVAYVGNMAASAAYWIASAADEIVIDATAQLGSIGVVMGWIDDSRAMEKAGYEEIEFVSSQSPNKRPDHKTDEGRAVIQQEVDDLAAVFVAAVAENRAVTTDKVIKDFNRGGLLVGAKAVAAGMADRLGSFEEVLAGLAGDTRDGPQGWSAANSMVTKEIQMADKTDGNQPVANEPAAPVAVSIDMIAQAHPDIAQHFRDEGATAERARIAAIDAVALPGHEKLVAELKADGSVTAGDAAQRIIAAEKTKLGSKLQGLKDAAKATDGLESAATTLGDPTADIARPGPDAPIEERARAEWDSSADIRGEFGAVETYVAYRRAEERGQIRGAVN